MDSATKVTMAGNHDPADANSGPWDPAVDPDTGHDSAADKHITERVPWDVPVPTEDPAAELPAGEVIGDGGLTPDPPVGQTFEPTPPAVEGTPV